MFSLVPSQSSSSVTYVAFTQSFVLDLRFSKLEKTFVVSARILKTIRPVISTRESWTCSTKTSSRHLDPQKGWISLCNSTNGASLHLLPFSEFNLQLHSRSERISMVCSGSEVFSDKAHGSAVKNTSSHRMSSIPCYKRESVSLFGVCSIFNLPIFTTSPPPSFATALHPDDEMCPNSAAHTLPSKFRSDESDADISPSISTIWARPIPFAKGVNPFSIPPNINFSERNKSRISLLAFDLVLILFNSFSMSLDGFTEPLIQTIVNMIWLPVDSPIPLSKTFSMRRVVSPAIKQMKLSKSLTVLLSCGAVCTGPEDATDFVPTMFRGVDCLSTSLFNVTKFQLSGFAVIFISTHSSFARNSLSIYPRDFSTLILYDVLSLCTVGRARIVPSNCSPNV